MTERPSHTSNHQRLQEMLCHLTPQKAVVPYNICFDDEGNFWVASKGGLFKFDSAGKKLLFERKNEFPKRMAPYTQVHFHNGKIIYVTCDDKAGLSEFQILSPDGTVEHEHFIEGKVQSVAVNQAGDLFMTKQPVLGVEESAIWRSHMDCPMAWEEFSTAIDESFQALCVFDDDTLAVAVVSLPVNIYSKQSIKWVHAKSGKQLGSFSGLGKTDGRVFFPRCLRPHGEALLVMDKTGRFQRFSRAGKFLGVAAKIDDFLGNGFVLTGDGQQAVIVCSGIVQNQNGDTICDDWVEAIRLDGSRWTPPEQ